MQIHAFFTNEEAKVNSLLHFKNNWQIQTGIKWEIFDAAFLTSSDRYYGFTLKRIITDETAWNSN